MGEIPVEAIRLSGDNSTIELVLTYDLGNVDRPTVRIITNLTSATRSITLGSDYCLWDDKVIEVLDLAICMAHIGSTDDTTELVEDIIVGSDYEHLLSWGICQEALDMLFVLQSRRTPRLFGKRHVLLVSLSDTGLTSPFSLLASADEFMGFANRLRAAYETIAETADRVGRHNIGD